MSSYRRSRSEMGSSSSVTNLDLDTVVKKYIKYKDMSKELIAENEKLKQKLENANRQLKLEELKAKDLEVDNAQLLNKFSAMEHSLENQHKESKKKISILQSTNAGLLDQVNEKDNLLDELKSDLNEKTSTLEKYVRKVEAQFSKMKMDEEVFYQCSSWWCPKHTFFEDIVSNLKPQTEEEKKIIRQAIARQKYWKTETMVRCCVQDRKTGKDKHPNPPKCLVEYLRANPDNSKTTSNMSIEEDRKAPDNFEISDDDENL